MPRAGLDLPTIVAAAGSLADRHGLEALTLRAVADHFGVKPPSLYNHVASVDALVRELHLHALDRLTRAILTAAHERTPEDAVRASAHAWRRFAAKHPGLYATTLRSPAKRDRRARDASARLLEAVFALLGGFGLTADAAVHAARALRAAIHGFVLLEEGGGFGLPVDAERSFEWMVNLLVDAMKCGSPGGT